MFGGGGGMNPRKMKQMMKQMGIDVEEIDAEEVVIKTTDGKELVFDDADVTQMDARGQQTYQIIGEPEEREAAETGEGEEADEEGEAAGEIPESDVEIVVQRTGATPEEARAALEGADGDLATAIDVLE
ncbi:nascent polypeptide-associated complex protein [Halarchaeum sp. P4]|uniref:nascent polypeptide-associated complex protein n=1 Tax=Halarchaeum sp. P4 TaxID=3421639 RepID=UPI003EC02743